MMLVAITLAAALTGCDKLRQGMPDEAAGPVITAKYDCVQAFGGKAPDYRDLVDLSANPGQVTLSVDTTAVNLGVTGSYPVIYTATDSAGNTSQLGINIQVYAPKQRVAFLTFDDGPSLHTPRILHILDSCDVRATFFVIGQNKKFFDYIGREHKAGHTVAAHSYSHEYSIYRNDTTYFDDLERIEQLIKHYTGHITPLVRMPGGSSNHMFRRYHPGNRNFMHQLVDSLEARGFMGTDWNVGGQDARGRNVPVQRIVQGAIHDPDFGHCQYLCVLMHDAVGKETTVQALPAIIAGLRAQGFVFAPLTKFSPRFQQLKPGTRIK